MRKCVKSSSSSYPLTNYRRRRRSHRVSASYRTASSAFSWPYPRVFRDSIQTSSVFKPDTENRLRDRSRVKNSVTETTASRRTPSPCTPGSALCFYLPPLLTVSHYRPRRTITHSVYIAISYLFCTRPDCVPLTRRILCFVIRAHTAIKKS